MGQVNIEKKIVELFDNGMLIDDIHKIFTIPVKTIVDIIVKDREFKSGDTKRCIRSSSVLYNLLVDGLTVQEIAEKKNLSIDDIYACIGSICSKPSIDRKVVDIIVSRVSSNGKKDEVYSRLGLETKLSFSERLKQKIGW